MRGSKRGKRGIRFHPGSSAVLLIDVRAHWGGETSQLEASRATHSKPKLSHRHTCMCWQSCCLCRLLFTCIISSGTSVGNQTTNDAPCWCLVVPCCVQERCRKGWNWLIWARGSVMLGILCWGGHVKQQYSNTLVHEEWISWSCCSVRAVEFRTLWGCTKKGFQDFLNSLAKVI